MTVRPGLLDVIGAPAPDVAPLPPAALCEPGVRLLSGIPYTTVPGGRPLEMDLWLPREPAGPLPLVLMLHGGAWARGRRDDPGLRLRSWRPGPFARIAADGFAVAAVDYRLSGEAPFPAQLHDVRAALEWLRLRSGELGTDPGRTVVWGESAGGHLASLLALAPGDVSPVGAVVWFGPADLLTARGGFDPARPGTPEARLLGAVPAEVPERAREASPLAQVHAGAPPFLLMHGAEDTMVPPSHSRDLAAALREHGADARLHEVPGADHAWFGAPGPVVEDVFTRSLAFVREAVGR